MRYIKSYPFIIYISGLVLALILGGVMLYAGLQHNPQGEFYDYETGKVHLADTSLLLFAPTYLWTIWFLIIWAIIMLVKLVIKYFKI
jgi:hypothetical protein